MKPPYVLSVDPGNSTGVALFLHGHLQTCFLAPQTYEYVSACFAGGLNIISGQPVVLICEMPQVYRASRSKGDPNHLMPLASAIGWWEMACHMWCAQPIIKRIKPREWKGQVPKQIHNTRVLSKLDSEEHRKFETLTKYTAAAKVHNIIDAVGLGLYELGRM